MLTLTEIVIVSVAGGLMRILIGISKKKTGFGFNRDKVLFTITTSLIIGIITAIILEPESYLIAFFAGFGGADVLEAMYRGIIKQKVGAAPISGTSGLSYEIGGDEYPQGLDKKQRKAIDYLYKYGQITSLEYRQMNRVSQRTAASDLNKMVTRKILRKCGSGKSTFYVFA
ncbi:MAG TPA: hypothetical protein VJ485_02410 [archaeon]|nr:hypothetical protein [archaeon]